MIAEVVLRIGCVPVEQDYFRIDHRTVAEMLREKIKACDVVIHVAGVVYGAEPGNRNAGEPRRSYTQMEYDIARELKKRVYVFICWEGFVYDDHPPEDPEKQRLQQEHRAALGASQTLRYKVISADELHKRVGELQTAFEAFAKQVHEAYGRNRRMQRLVVALLAVVVVCGAVLGRNRLIQLFDPDQEYLEAYERSPSDLGTLAVQACEKGRISALSSLAQQDGGAKAMRGSDAGALHARIIELAAHDPERLEPCVGTLSAMGWDPDQIGGNTVGMLYDPSGSPPRGYMEFLLAGKNGLIDTHGREAREVRVPALMLAIWHNDARLVSALLRAGASPENSAMLATRIEGRVEDIAVASCRAEADRIGSSEVKAAIAR